MRRKFELVIRDAEKISKRGFLRVRGFIIFEYEGEHLVRVKSPSEAFVTPSESRQLEKWLRGYIGQDKLTISSLGHATNLSFKEDLCKIQDDILELKRIFSDAQERQIALTKLKHSITCLSEKLGLESRIYLRVLNMCLDALKNVKAEQLNRKQLDSLEFALGTIGEDLTYHSISEVQKILFKAGLKPIPDLEGIAELYT